MNSKLYQAIQECPISDTHEHSVSTLTLKENRRSVIELIGEAYLHDDLLSAGAK